MIIPFTYNILKRHPALMVMIHSTGEDDGDFNGNATCLSHLPQIIA